MKDQDFFPDFARLWAPLCLAKSVKTTCPQGLILGGERIALFRDAQGHIQALLDRCPHRGVALSLGKVENGELTCPFHGWRFNGSGACVHVPWNPDAKHATLRATALPVREIGGLIWIFTGLNSVDEPNIPKILLSPDIRVTSQTFHWNVHWTRVMENMLDAPHLPFVHAKTIGKHLRARAGMRMEMIWENTEYGGKITSVREDEPPRSNLRYYFPSTMEMRIDPGNRILRLLAVCNPAETGKTTLTIYTMRNFAKAKLFDPLFSRTNAKIAAEDKEIIESSLPTQVPPARDEVSVPTDAPTLAFRKIWFTQIKDHKAPDCEH